jgi:PAS domain S-box-containing protein
MMAAEKKEPEEKKTDSQGIKRMLRDDAEEQLTRSPESSPNIAGQTPEELVHELQVHQIELETQAEELRRAHLALGESRDKYLDLYEFAPVGYLTLNDKALVTGVNLTSATLLGVERDEIINHGLGRFIVPTDHEKWDRYFVDVRNQTEKQICTLMLIRGDGLMFPARLEGFKTTSGNGELTTIRITISDISDIWQIEALRESELFNRGLVENLPEYIIVYGPDGKILYVNPATVRALGYNTEELVGTYVLSYIAEEHRDEVISTMKLRQEGREVPAYETVLVAHDGHRRSVIVKGILTQYHDSPASLILLVDITERKRAEEALHESVQYNRNLIEVSLDPLVTISPEGKITDVNAATERVTGYSRDYLIGTDFSNYFTDTEKAREGYRKVFDESVVLDYPLEIRHRDGKTISVLYNATIYRHESGAVQGVFAAARDITERKHAEEALHESEERYHNVVEDQTEFICRFLPDGTHIFVNDAYCRYFDKKREEIIGHRFKPVLHPEDREMVARHIASISQEHPVIDIDQRIIMPDGSTRWQRWSDRAIFDQNGRVVEYQSVGRDITEQKELEMEMEYHAQELQQYSISLATANKKLNLLSSITRHDINNQLTILTGYLTILEKQLPDTSFSDYFLRVSNAAKRISAMVKFTREYEEIGVKVPAWQDTRTLVDTAAKQAPLGMVLVKNDLPAGAEVFADPLVVKVFYNLMDNAVRYGGKITTIRFSVDELDGDHVVVCEDDGDGIVAAEKEKIFERGFGKNTGLGLALSREILSITGIRITETGESGKGARFEMTVPKGAWRMEVKSD